jgi:hypothetical protein
LKKKTAIGNNLLLTPIATPTAVYRSCRCPSCRRCSSRAAAYLPLFNRVAAVHCDCAVSIHRDCATAVHLMSPAIVPLSVKIRVDLDGIGVGGGGTTPTGW